MSPLLLACVDALRLVRYGIRGIRNIIFYGLPDHPQFYPELRSCRFLGENVKASHVTCKLVYCKYDVMRVERVVGSEVISGTVEDQTNWRGRLLITKARFGSYVRESVGSCGRETVYKASRFRMLSFLSADSPTGM